MELKDLVDQLDAKITEVHEKYVGFHKEFDAFRGKEVGDKVDEVNRILFDLQTVFQELYPALHFIGSRHQYAVNVCNSHDAFIESIKKAGGTTYNPDEPANS